VFDLLLSGRIILCNAWGTVLLDQYAKPLEAIVSYRTKKTGITAANLKTALSVATVKKRVMALVEVSASILIREILLHNGWCIGSLT